MVVRGGGAACPAQIHIVTGTSRACIACLTAVYRSHARTVPDVASAHRPTLNFHALYILGQLTLEKPCRPSKLCLIRLGIHSGPDRPPYHDSRVRIPGWDRLRDGCMPVPETTLLFGREVEMEGGETQLDRTVIGPVISWRPVLTQTADPRPLIGYRLGSSASH